MQRKIRFGDIKFNQCAKEAVLSVLNSNEITMGKHTSSFEERWANLSGSKYSVAVNSGTSALISLFSSLYGLGAKRGQNIIMPALSFVSTWNSAIASGFNIKLVDTEIENSMNLDINKIEEQIDKDTIAICCVSLIGKPYKAKVVKDICKKYKLFHIADQCEAHFCTHYNKPISYYSDAECYSFYIAHCIAFSEFGAVNTNNKEISDLCRSTRTHGRKNGSLYFDFENFGLNLKPNDIAAVLGLEALNEAKNIFLKRKQILSKLQNSIRKYKDLVWLVEEESYDLNSPHALSVTFKKEGYIDKFKQYLTDFHIEWKRNFQIPHESSAFKWMNLNKKDVKNADWISNQGLHTACHQYLSDEDVEYMIEIFEKFFKII